VGLRGDLLNISLWEVFQLLSSGRKTGKLEIKDNGRNVEIHFEEGKIVYAKLGNLENYSALLDLALWRRGSFIFNPEEKIIKSSLELDPFEIFINAIPYIDRMDYLGGFILIPIREDVSVEENSILSLFDGVRKVGDVIDLSPLPRVKTLEILNKLMSEKKLIKVNEEKELFWIYIFWRYWHYILKEYPEKGISERNIRRNWYNFLSKRDEKVKSIFEEITEEKGVSVIDIYAHLREEDIEESDLESIYQGLKESKLSWPYFYKHLKEYTTQAIENFSKISINYLSSLYKVKTGETPYLDKIRDNLNEIYIYIGTCSSDYEEIISLFLNGENTLKNIIDEKIFGEETFNIIEKLLREKKIISLKDDKKVLYSFTFWRFWNELKNKIQDKKVIDKIYISLDEFLRENLKGLENIFGKLINDLNPNWRYVYRSINKLSDDEVKKFVENLINTIFENGINLLGKTWDKILKESLDLIKEDLPFKEIELFFL